MALLELQRSESHEVVGLMTTIGMETGRIAIHNVHRDLVRAQARSLGLPLHEVPLATGASNAQYEEATRMALSRPAGPNAPGCTTVAYGDLFLEDIRTYREALAERLGVTPTFPVWGRDTGKFAQDFLAVGFEAIVVSVNLARLDGSLAGRRLDASFLAELPADVDPCGENGEFHTFVVDGPNFMRPVPVVTGAFVERDLHCYRDLHLR